MDEPCLLQSVIPQALGLARSGTLRKTSGVRPPASRRQGLLILSSHRDEGLREREASGWMLSVEKEGRRERETLAHLQHRM